MDSIGGLDHIFADHFKPYRVETTSNRFELPHALLVVAIPIVGGLAIGIAGDQFVASNSAAIIGVYAVMASVMTAVMPTIHGLIGTVDRERIRALKEGSETSDLNINETKTLIAKVEIVRGLYASVAWSVIVLSLSLIPLLAISHGVFQTDRLTPPAPLPDAWHLTRVVLAVLIGFSGTTAFVGLLQIVTGVHIMVRHSQIDVESDLVALKRRYRV